MQMGKGLVATRMNPIRTLLTMMPNANCDSSSRFVVGEKIAKTGWATLQIAEMCSVEIAAIL